MLNFELQIFINKKVADHNDFGKKGEEIAKNYLAEKGYLILESNWTIGKLEVDIIAKTKDFIVFIEVKTRSSSYIIEPEASVNRTKQKNIIRAANKYIVWNKIQDEARFDIITVLGSDEKYIITHIEDAFYPTL